MSRPSSEVRPLDCAPGVRLHGGTAMLAAAVVLALVFAAFLTDRHYGGGPR